MKSKAASLEKGGIDIEKENSNAKKAQSGKKNTDGGKKRRGAKKNRLEELTCCLTEELFEIAMGQRGPADGEKGTAVSMSERLKAAELLAKYRKNPAEGEGAAKAVIIIDDIK